jgi:antitoxin PrlF
LQQHLQFDVGPRSAITGWQLDLPLTATTLMLYILVKQKTKEAFMALAKLSSKSQVVLPAKIRRKLGISPGDMIEITEQDEKIILRKAPISFLRELEICCSETWQDYERELQQEREEWDH